MAPSLQLLRLLLLRPPLSRAAAGAPARVAIARDLCGIAASRFSSDQLPKGLGSRPLSDVCRSPALRAWPVMVSRQSRAGARASGALTARDRSRRQAPRLPCMGHRPHLRCPVTQRAVLLTPRAALQASRRVARTPHLSARARPRKHRRRLNSRLMGGELAPICGRRRPFVHLPSTSRPLLRHQARVRHGTRCLPSRRRSTVCRHGRCLLPPRCHALPRQSSQRWRRCQHPQEGAV